MPNPFTIRARLSFVAALLLAALASCSASLAQPAGKKHFSTKAAFEDVLADLKDAIVNRGLVIDYTGHVDKMLERTSAAAGSVTETGSKSPYLHAKYIQFCSAKLTHQAVSANPYNLAICPYVIFVFEAKSEPGKIVVGYRRPIAGPSKYSKTALGRIETLLDGIAKEATGG